MIRISPAFDFNAERRKNGLQTEPIRDDRAGAVAAAGNRPFTMPREWGAKRKGGNPKDARRRARGATLVFA
jgi:hypothetical protein